MKYRIDRNFRVQTGCDKLLRAADDPFNPIAISNAFRYMKNSGRGESELILRRFFAESPHDGTFLYFRLPFLYESGDGIPPRDTSFAEAGGLIFHVSPNGLLPSVSIDEIDFANLNFTNLSFVPDDDLSATLDIAVSKFEDQLVDSQWRPRDLIELHVNWQAMRMLGRDNPRECVSKTSLRWDSDSESFKLDANP